VRPVPVQCSSCLLRSPRGKPRSPDELVVPFRAPLCPASRSVSVPCWDAPGTAAQRSVPTQNVVREISEITPSSSSSQVWKLGIEPLRAVQGGNDPVGRLWAVTVLLLSTRGHLDGCSPSSVGVHSLSPVSPGWIPSPCPGLRTVLDRCRGRSGVDGAYVQLSRLDGGTGPVRGPGGREPRRGPWSPAVTRRVRDLPNLCTSLGTTSRCVDDGHRPDTGSYRVRRGPHLCRHLSTAVDNYRDRAQGPGGAAPARATGEPCS
jgi:hypothetical protein